MSVEQMSDRVTDEGDVVGAESESAPELDDRPSGPAKRKPATSRPLWLVAYVLVLLLMALRIPQAYEYVRGHVPPQMLAEIHDAEMERLALKSGVFVGFVLTALIAAIYFSLAAVLERKMFTVGRVVGGRFSFGIFFLVAALCTVPVHVVAMVFDVPNPREFLLYYAYIAGVGLLSPLAFRGIWKGLPMRKIAILFTATLVYSLLTAIG